MKCPSCGATVRSDAKYCVRCGATISPNVRQSYCPQCHKPVSKNAKFCPFCSAPLRPVHRCRRCGQPCEPGKILCAKCRKQKRRAVILTVILLLFALLIAAIIGMLLFAPEWIPWREAEDSSVLTEDSGNDEDQDTETERAAEEETANEEMVEEEAEPVSPTIISLDQEQISLEDGDSVLVTANLDIDPTDWEGTVEWLCSGDDAVVNIAPKGKNQAQISWNAAGECTILAMVENSSGNELYASCTVQCLESEPEVEFPVGTVEFNGHHYKVYLEETDWASAQATCEAMEGHLATITSEEENQFVYELACTYSTELAFLLGGTDQEEEGTFVWVTGEPFEYTNWGYLNEPDNYREYKDQDYITLLTFDQTGKYHDDSGESWGIHASEWDDKDGQSNPYICEWDF